MSKLIFMDVDGVLNDHERVPFSEMPANYTSITQRCVANFNRIILACEAVVVLSSSWRYLILNEHMSIHGFQTLLTSHGVRGHLISHTRADAKLDNDDYEPRWMQIRDWLKEPLNHKGQKVSIDRYCIIDDDPDAFGGRPGVQTNGAVGLTEKDADEAIAILNRKDVQ